MQRICYPLQNKYQGLQPKKSISFLKCFIVDINVLIIRYTYYSYSRNQ